MNETSSKRMTFENDAYYPALLCRGAIVVYRSHYIRLLISEKTIKEEPGRVQRIP